MTSEYGRVTALLRRIGAGDRAAANELLPLVYDELRLLAHAQMRGQPPGHVLQTTALLNEAWLRMAGSQPAAFKDRRHFLGVASSAMRSVLVDDARGRGARKRSAGLAHVAPDGEATVSTPPPDLVLDLDEALERLAAVDHELARIAELRCFAGLSSAEAALVLDVSKRTVERAWRTARAWLQRELEECAGDHGG
ncbi:MAG: ECF-type sigma factor [Planctomycetota bacterium]